VIAGRLRTARVVLAAAAIVQLAVAHPLVHAQGHIFGWKVSKGQGAIYVIGSVHLLSKDFYPLHPALEAAYQDSDYLVEEVDIGEMTGTGSQLTMLTRGMQPSSQPLEKALSPSTLALLTKKSSELGLPMEALKQFKPWMIALTVEAMEWTKAGFDPELGLDKHFYEQAKRDGKVVQGLETIEYQISRFDEMPLELQDHLLAETLKSLDTERASMKQMIGSWGTGDAAAVERIVLKDLQQEPQLYKRLLVERNTNWMPKLDALFARKGRALVVVGAAHLVGPDGLLTMFRAKGYKVEQL
jgi:uncharacterized protein YbaP (TraB family)